MQLFENISYLDLGEEEMGRLGQVAVGGAGLLTGVGVARWKARPAIEKCLLKFSIIVDLSVVTVLPSLSAVGSSYSPWTLQCSRTFLSLCCWKKISA